MLFGMFLLLLSVWFGRYLSMLMMIGIVVCYIMVIFVCVVLF